jgi:hypothetical protein
LTAEPRHRAKIVISQDHQWDFFIAHAGPDTVRAEQLYALLKPHARVFLDSQCLELGDAWDEALGVAQKDSMITVVLVSPGTPSAYYQREEIAGAVHLSRQAGRHHRVIPIYTDPAQPVDIPFGLRRLHAITLSDEVSLRSASARLLRTFDRDRAKFGASRTSDPQSTSGAATIPLEYGDERKDAEFPDIGADRPSLGLPFPFERIFKRPRENIAAVIDKGWAAASFALTIIGLSGLAHGLIQWRDFFDYGIMQQYIELRTWLFGFLPFQLPGWVGDYVTLGLAVSYPIKGIVAEAKKNLPTLETRLKIATRAVEKNKQAAEQAMATRIANAPSGYVAMCPEKGVTLGIGVLAAARNSLMLAIGKQKRKAVRKLISGFNGIDIPARALTRSKNFVLMVDEDAAPL